MFTDDGYYTYTYKVNMADDGNSWAGYTTSSSGSTKTVSFVRLQGAYYRSRKLTFKNSPRFTQYCGDCCYL